MMPDCRGHGIEHPYRFSFFIQPGALGDGGLCVQPRIGTRALPRTDDIEVAVTAAIEWLRTVEPGNPYDRAKVHRRVPGGEHPVWVRADGERFTRGADDPLEAWGYASS